MSRKVKITLRKASEVNRPRTIMEGKNPNGDVIEINNKYLKKNNEPRFPVMGEIHYLRVHRSQWRESLIKMKAGGINIISTYIFWIYHEEIENQLIWSNNHDLRHFIKLCKELELYVLRCIKFACFRSFAREIQN